MKKFVALFLVTVLALSTVSVALADYPEHDLTGSIMWGAGGGTDVTARALTVLAEKDLGVTVVMTNRAGGGGAICSTYVYEQPADGYELMFGAENPQVAKVMGTANIDYDDFEPIVVYCSSAAACVVGKDSKYNSFEELVEDMKNNTILEGSTGAGGLSFSVAALMTSIHGVKSAPIIYDGEAAVSTALMGGEVDFGLLGLGSVSSHIKNGDLKALAIFNLEPVEGLEDVPLVTDIYPEYANVLPCGTFYGVFVKKGTDQAIIDKLTAAYAKAAQTEEIHDLLVSLGQIPRCLTGDDAKDFVNTHRARVDWLIYDAGGSTIEPSSFGVARP